MSENKDESSKEFVSLEATRASLRGEVESAKILLQEGLLEEAKKILHRVLFLSPEFQKARDLLALIHKKELEQIHRSEPKAWSKPVPEDPDSVIQRLTDDLDLGLENAALDPAVENWKYEVEVSAKEHFDLGIAFFEMGCYRDAVRELKKVIQMVHIETSEPGEIGIAAIGLCAEALIELESGFEAKIFLDPYLLDPQLMHEDKITLYYMMGRAEENLGNRKEAKAWYQKVLLVDPFFRDAEFRSKRM